MIRPDIQALRAVAVVMVLLYHLWPNRLTGGYAGVDVFFVISGFLITSHLLLKPPRRAVDLLRFWSRRIRRLLPAACLVLSATLAASRLVAPNTMWGATASHVKAAALYFVNWQLASDSVDYLAREESATPVEHFWSLSVEEQFYLVWPVLILLLLGIALVLRGRKLLVVGIGLTALVAASLVYSIFKTGSDPSEAYFVTPTRMWELGIGGLLAVLLVDGALGRKRETNAVKLPPAARTVLCWVGFAAIAWTAFTYTDATPFPGWQALLPVLGSAAVIAAYVQPGPGSPSKMMGLRPVQWLGDVSYSVYLWHWPMIVLLPYVSGGHLGRLDKAVVIAATLVLAGLTKRFVEDRFRAPTWGRPLYKPYALGATLMAIVVVASVAQLAEVNRAQAAAVTQAEQAVNNAGNCFGADALAPLPRDCPPTTSGPLTPPPIQAKKDKSVAYAAVSGKSSCWSDEPTYELVKCMFGDKNAPVKVALIGNSHAGSFLPAVLTIAGAQDWSVTTYLASSCALNLAPQDWDFTAGEDRKCRQWVKAVTDTVVAEHFDLVIFVNRTPIEKITTDRQQRIASYQHGYQQVLQKLSRANVPTVVIRDTPFAGSSIPDCLARHPENYAACNGSKTDWLVPDPTVQAVADIADPNIVLLDLTSYLCLGPTCFAAVGGVPVYFDGSHLTATYSRTLAPFLEPTLVTMLNG